MATILVVDDERLVCDLFRTVLHHHGHEVLTAIGGREGIKLFRERRPRFTLLDLNMPEMNGIEVLKQIRETDLQAAVIMMTGHATEDLKNQAFELGVTDFLSKGSSLEALERVMERVMKLSPEAVETPPQSAGPAAEPSGTPAGESILVVDDEPQVRDLLRDFLNKCGYRVRTAQDGPTALALVEQEWPQLIVLDMYMPGMNGPELLRELRSKEYGGGVIVLTGSQNEKMLLEVLNLGATEILSKPVDLERLELAVQVGCILAEL